MSPYYRHDIKCKTNDCSMDVNSFTLKICSVQKKYKIENVNPNMFSNERCSHAFINIINKIQSSVESQDELNAIYEKFVDVLHSQMDMNFKIYDSGNKK